MEQIREILDYYNKGTVIELEKLRINTEVMNRWLFLKSRGIGISDFLVKKGWKKVVIYGGAQLGERIYDELTETGIEILYIIDQNPDAVNLKNLVNVYSLEEEWNETPDIMIVTPVYYFNEIKEQIKGSIKCPIVSIKEILWAL